MNKLSFRLMATTGASVIVGAAALISANTYAHREYRDAIGRVPVSLQQPPATGGGEGSGGGKDTTAAKPASGGMASMQDNQRIAWVVSKLMTRQNFLHHAADKTISQRLFDRFLDAWDPRHEYFLNTDIAEWLPQRDQVAIQIDTKDGDTAFAQTVFARFKQHVTEQQAFVMDALKTKDFNFTSDDTFQIDVAARKKAPRPANLDEAKEMWWQRLRAEYLQEKLTRKKPEERTPEKIKEFLTKRYVRLGKALNELNEDNVFERYLTIYAEAFDPHSDYFGKASTEDFGIHMNLSLFGIGATLQQSDEGFVKIMTLVPGGPAFKGKKLKVGDQITSVTQGESGEPVDVQDMNINKVVSMIRGAKGTPVKLTILPGGSADPSIRKEVTIIRDEVHLEEEAAKAQIIDLNAEGGDKAMRVGVISLPSFYGGAGSQRSATEDVKRLLGKLRQQKVAGVILDLRLNPGGSLPEAIGVAGLFIPKGPVVQVVSSSSSGRNRTTVDQDEDPTVSWDGPLVVLANKGSASASEIVTGALKDYGRALVVGDSQTFGKGTVQVVIDLQNVLQQVNLSTQSDPGSVHLTIQQFYLPGGSSTQREGVKSDIILPSATGALEVGEKTLDNPLPWNKIPPAEFSKTNRVAPYLIALKSRSQSRVAASKLFVLLRQDIQRFQAQKNQPLSLNEAKRLKEKNDADLRDKQRKALIATLNASSKERVYPITLADVVKPGLPSPLRANALLAKNGGVKPSLDADTLAADASSDDVADSATTDRDITLDEAKRILADYVTLSHK